MANTLDVQDVSSGFRLTQAYRVLRQRGCAESGDLAIHNFVLPGAMGFSSAGARHIRETELGDLRPHLWDVGELNLIFAVDAIREHSVVVEELLHPWSISDFLPLAQVKSE